MKKNNISFLKDSIQEAIKKEGEKLFLKRLFNQREKRKDFLKNLHGVKKILFRVLNRDYIVERHNVRKEVYLFTNYYKVILSSSCVVCVDRITNKSFALNMDCVRCYNSLDGLLDLYKLIR